MGLFERITIGVFLAWVTMVAVYALRMHGGESLPRAQIKTTAA
jgi:hypothetical protein